MKKLILSFAVIFLIAGCKKDFFEQIPDDRLTIDQVFQERNYSERYLANVYMYIMDESDQSMPNRVPWFNMTDEGDVTRYGQDYNVGNWDASSSSYNFWDHYYKGIRSATYFMQRIGENKEILNSEGGAELIIRYRAEARALRAWFYAALIKQYGPVVILPGDEVVPVDVQVEDTKRPRNTYDECVEYIISELDKAAEELPLWYNADRDYGRMNKAVCLALKARVLLYAASPLNNGNTMYSDFLNIDGEPLINQTYDETKWKQAADAAKDVIDLGLFSLYKEYNSGELDPFLSYQNLFFKKWNEEVIFARNNNELTGSNCCRIWDRRSSPRFTSGYSANGPTQKLVDAYQMNNGTVPITGYNSDGSPIINSASGYIESGFSTEDTKYTESGTWNMYVNREPRFYASIIYSGAYWVNKADYPMKVEMFYRGNNGKFNAGSDYSSTGYLPRKNIHPETNYIQKKYVYRPLIMMRLAEIYLSYAEALNEYDPGNPDIAKYINLVRERGGIPDLPSGLSQNEMRDRIHRERQIELAFERTRFFDTRRWLIAEETDGGIFYGMDIDSGENSTDPSFYNRVKMEDRVFEKRNYLWPIPQNEIDINGDIVVQNPGW